MYSGLFVGGAQTICQPTPNPITLIPTHIELLSLIYSSRVFQTSFELNLVQNT